MTDELSALINIRASLDEQIKRVNIDIDEATAEHRADAIADIKGDIAEFGIKPADLFDAACLRAINATARVSVKPKTKAGGSKYRDELGGTWGGIGKRPDWLKAGLAAGRTLESYRVAG